MMNLDPMTQALLMAPVIMIGTLVGAWLVAIFDTSARSRRD